MVRSEEYAGRPLANGVLERLAGLEARDAPLRDLDGRTGLRVASGARLALARGERAETDEGDRVALLQAARDAVDQRIDPPRRRPSFDWPVSLAILPIKSCLFMHGSWAVSGKPA